MKIAMTKRPEFMLSVVDPLHLPDHGYFEVAFFGASNVGKSSLINAVCNKKNLAKTSKTPGRTQMLNFFTFPPQTVLVDVPGYGFASVPPSERKHWQDLLLGYLASRAARMHAYLLLDSRRFLRPNDLDVLRIFQEYGIAYTLVFTKFDKLNNYEQDNLKQMAQEQFGQSCLVFFTSARTRLGVEDLRRDVRERT
ncbi:MAG: ribosome biogenesis GTP-binding protein YihA/YsxC [Holosporales bacterium]|jgi:GTP-binding protein|nr:ribosome biogenesis GTP-binding protein YihA/YsxC [Holosporales bacterium]